METRDYSGAGLSRCASIPKRPAPDPSGKRRQCSRRGPIRSTVGARTGFPGAMRSWEAVRLPEDEAAAAGAGYAGTAGAAAGLPASRFGLLRESYRPAGSRSPVRTVPSKATGRLRRGVRNGLEGEKMLRRIGACVPGDFAHCRRTRRREAAGLDGPEVSGGVPAGEGAAR